ncbi:MAG TPA: uroporphyrinogen-III synthase [Paracoccaceae bacterium]|nr:uroporphyrinogen-III synthase [Paracoccaceae bacterium]
MTDSSARLLLTRPEAEARDFAAAIEAAWGGRFELAFLPLTEIVHETAPVALEGIQGLLFTSANGVRAFAEANPRRELPALCVGPGTAEAARRAGFSAESADGDAGALARLAANAWMPGAGAFLHVRGRDSAGDLVAALAPEGIEVREVVLYDARAISGVPAEMASVLEAGAFDAVLFFSPRAGKLFAAFAAESAAAGRGWALKQAAALCISRAVAAQVQGLGFGGVRVAARPDRAGMLAGLGQFVRG